MRKSIEAKVEDYCNYIIIHPQSHKVYSTKLKNLKGKLVNHIHNAIPDLRFGTNDNAGPILSGKFTKTDQKGLREARYFNQGIGGLAQLASVYNVSLKMRANSVLYPGQCIWVELSDLSKTREFTSKVTQGSINTGSNKKIMKFEKHDPKTNLRPNSPCDPESLANNLGIGGYHLVKKVSISIQPGGKYSNSAEAVWFSSGMDTPTRSDVTEEELAEQAKNCTIQDELDKAIANIEMQGVLDALGVSDLAEKFTGEMTEEEENDVEEPYEGDGSDLDL